MGLSYALQNSAGTSTQITANETTKRSRDLSQSRRVSINVDNRAAESVTFTVEGSLDGVNWSTISYGYNNTGAYTATALTLAASAKAILFLPPDDFVRYVRVNVSDGNATNGTYFTVYGD